MKKIASLLVFSIICLIKCYGQVEEIETEKLEKFHTTINLGKNGLAFEHFEDKYFEWVFYDSDLKKQESVKYDCKNTSEIKTSLRYYDSTTESLYIVKGNDKTDKELIIIPIKTNELKIIKLNAKDRINIKSIFIFDKKAFFESIINDYSSELLREDPYSEFSYGSINLENGKVEKLKLPEVWKSRKIEVIDKINSSYMAITYSDKKSKSKNIAVINAKEDIISDELINKNIFSPLLNFSFTDLGNDQFLVTGEYYTDNKSTDAEGIFAAKFINFKSAFLNYYTFNEISDYNKYKVTITGKQARLYKYRHQLHTASKLNGNYVIIGECIIPTIYVIGKGFQHFLYSHSLFLTIDESGNKVEDDCIKINMPETSFRLDKVFDIRLNNQELIYVYCNENKLYKVIYKDGNIEVNKPVVQIKDKHEFDELILYKDRIEFKYWFENYYYGFLSLVPNKKYTFIQPSESEYSPLLIKYELH